MRRNILCTAALGIIFCLLTISQCIAKSQPVSNKEIVLQSNSLSARFNRNGNLQEISLLNNDEKNWIIKLPEAEGFWFMFDNGKTISPNTTKLISLNIWKDSQGSVLETVHECAASQLRITFIYRIDNSEPTMLKTHYRLSSSSSKSKTFRFYINTIGNLKATDKCWVVYPLWGGQLIRADKVKDGERPAPGHMWMQFMGYYDDEGHGILSYPRDTTGFLKYATLCARNGLTFLWSDVVVLPANGQYDLPFDYILEPMMAPDTFNTICHAYANWGRKQSWMVTVDDKIKARPELKNLISEGIIKDVCFEGLGMDKRTGKKVPSTGVFFAKSLKEQMIQDPAPFELILNHARSLEKLYSVKPVYRLDGWWGRFDSAYPFVLPVNERLGGDEKFKWFLKENEHDGRVVVLHDNPIQYDTEMKQYDKSQMAMNEDGTLVNLSIWSGNRLALASPKFAIPQNLEIVQTLKKWGATGIWWDVLGASTPFIDFNPSAHYPYYGRDSFYQCLLVLFAALRDAAPNMIFGTENGQEMMLPYFDWAPAYALGPEDATITWAPLNDLVYGDAFIQGAGIDGNGPKYDNVRRVTGMLYGAILGGDGREVWTSEYTPVIQGIFETNAVLGEVATKQMQRHVINPRGWRASCWPNAVVIGNTDSDQPIDVTLDTPFGKVTAEKICRNGFVALTDQGHWICWGAGKLSLNGQVVVTTSTPEMIVINNSKRLTVFRYLYREPTDADMSLNSESWKLSCPPVANAILANGLKSIPFRTDIKVDKKSDITIQFDAPALKDAYRVDWNVKK